MFKTKNLTYLGIIIVLGVVITFLIISSGKFFAERINNSFQVDESKVNSTGAALDLATFNKIAPRLGLTPIKI